jgi:hypothetical protein
MKLPPDATFLEAPPLLIWRPRDVLNEASVNRILAFIGEEEAISGKRFDRFTDMSLVNSVDRNFKFIFHVALYRRLSWAGHPKVKSAFYVHTPAADATNQQELELKPSLEIELPWQCYGYAEWASKWNIEQEGDYKSKFKIEIGRAFGSREQVVVSLRYELPLTEGSEQGTYSVALTYVFK